MLTLSEAFEAGLTGGAHGLSTAILDWAHVFTSRSSFSEKLLEWSEKDLLRILKWNIPVFAFFAGVYANCANNELLLGVNLHEFLFTWDLISDWRHRPVDTPTSRRRSGAHQSLAIQLTGSQGSLITAGRKLSSDGLVSDLRASGLDKSAVRESHKLGSSDSKRGFVGRILAVSLSGLEAGCLCRSTGVGAVKQGRGALGLGFGTTNLRHSI